MNLYNFHTVPESLLQYKTVSETNLHIFWDKYRNNKEELKKREKYIAADAEYAFYYARDVLKGPFPAGEVAIARDAEYAKDYAEYVLKGPFPAGEAAIAKDAGYAKDYAEYVLKADFYYNGKLIAKAS